MQQTSAFSQSSFTVHCDAWAQATTLFSLLQNEPALMNSTRGPLVLWDLPSSSSLPLTKADFPGVQFMNRSCGSEVQNGVHWSLPGSFIVESYSSVSALGHWVGLRRLLNTCGEKKAAWREEYQRFQRTIRWPRWCTESTGILSLSEQHEFSKTEKNCPSCLMFYSRTSRRIGY